MGANESDADQHKDTNCDSNFAAAAVSNGYSFYTIRQTCPTLATATATSTALVHPMDPVGAVSTVTSGRTARARSGVELSRSILRI